MSDLDGARKVTVYLIHFDTPYKHAHHYIGVTAGALEDRLQRHRNGNGANLMAVIKRAGITWRVAHSWADVPRFTEMRLKRRGSAKRICPLCGSKPPTF